MFQIAKILVLFSMIISNTLYGKLTGRQIMEKQKNLHKVKSESEIQKMILIDRSGSKEVRDLKRYVKETAADEYKVVMIFTGPANIKGTSILTWQHKNKADDQWLFLPAQGKLQRIAKSGKKNYFLGTDYTYEDLQTENPDNYKYTIIKEDTCGNKKKSQCYFIESTPINSKVSRSSGYGKRILHVRKDIFVTITTEYYNKRKKLVKTQTTDGWYNLSGTIWRAKRALMINHKKNHKTLIGSVSLQVDKTLNDNLFSENYILKGKHTN